MVVVVIEHPFCSAGDCDAKCLWGGCKAGSVPSKSTRQFKCANTNCSYVGNKRGNLNRHVRLCMRFKCESCSLRFKTESQFRNHNKSVHGVIPFQCALCDYSTDKSYSLRSHQIARHGSGESERKKYQCLLCDFSTARKSYLKVHKINRHNECSRGRRNTKAERIPIIHQTTVQILKEAFEVLS
jgi:Zinc finger, C2H2 type